jgi:predicted transcriptional regulator
VAISLSGSNVRAALVGKNGGSKGLISLEDVVRGIAEGKKDLPVEESMEREYPVVDGDEPLHVAISKLAATGAAQIVVTQSDVPFGMLDATDLARCMIRF